MGRVLVACERSGIVRDAFRSRGHDAVSCDLVPTEAPGPHIIGNALAVLGDGWDLLIAHPPCTYLANLANRWLWQTTPPATPGVLVGPARWAALIEGATFFRELLAAPIGRVCVENPVMGRYARMVVGVGPSQVVQPYWFGHTNTKATGLWLRGLPALRATDDRRADTYALPYRDRAISHLMAPSPDRTEKRSRTYPGLADAMAAQWGAGILEGADDGL